MVESRHPSFICPRLSRQTSSLNSDFVHPRRNYERFYFLTELRNLQLTGRKKVKGNKNYISLFVHGE